MTLSTRSRRPASRTATVAARSRRRNAFQLAVLAAVVLVTAQAASAGPASGTGAQATTTLASAERPLGLALPGLLAPRYRITLVTGDVVELTAAGGGYSATFEPAVRADGSEPAIRIEGFDDDLYAIPEDVDPLIASGRLDKELFNVGYLAANGYADAVRGTVPVIAEYEEHLDAPEEQQRAQALPASNVTNTLESIDAVALTVSKSHAQSFWRSVRGEQEPNASSAALEAGVTKLWLDRKVEAALDESVPQIGAPAAWAAGYDGTGVKVAVLDTGIDAAHADVAGKVVASRSFIPNQEVADGHGHGTHVAATVAGTGAAQGGLRKGVAPGAQLVIGKVLGDSGSGPFSGVIEGMEWAAVEQDADVVNMSLGSPPTAGTDPASQAVNRLTRDTGTLFVIAAGNSGRSGSFTIGAPGAADSALTVAAVNKTDQLADFSSRGPRFGDSALKPDIAAPGVGVVAARAAGTTMGTPVDDLYTRANGTSMAAPHVAGAAAVLAQKYPDWTATQLKPALMSTAKDAGYTVYEQGSGRVDLARSVTQQVFATTASLDFKAIGFDDDAPKTRTVTYSNLTSEAIVLDLAAQLKATDGPAVPAGTLVAPGSVTVPAGGTASVDVTLNAGPLESDTYTGALVATGAGGTQLTTPIGFAVGEQLFELTVTVIRRQKDAGPWKHKNAIGCGFTSEYSIFVKVGGVAGEGLDRDPPAQTLCWHEPAPPEHSVTFHVPKGTYFAHALSSWHFEGRVHSASLIEPEFEVTGATHVVLDADDAKPISIETPKPSEIHNVVAQFTRTTTSGNFFNVAFSPNAAAGPMLWVTPTEPVTKGKLAFSPHYLLGAPRITALVERPKQIELHPVPGYTFTESRDFFTDSRRYRNLSVVDAGDGTAEDFAGIDARGKLVLLRVEPSADPGAWAWPWIRGEQLQRAAAAGAVGALYHPGEGFYIGNHGGVRVDGVLPEGFPYAVLPTPEADQLIELVSRGTVKISLEGIHRPETPYLYSLKTYEEGHVPSDLRYEFEERDLARIDAHIHASWNSWIMFRTPTRRPGEFVTFPPHIDHMPYPRTVPVYVGPVYPDAMYEVGANGGTVGGWHEHGLYDFDRPGRVEAHVGLPPLVPGVPDVNPRYAATAGAFTVCSGCRQGDTFYPQMTAVSGQRHLQTSPFLAGSVEESEVHLYRDGVEIPSRPWLGALPVFDLQSDPGRYTLEIDEQGSKTSWQFTSSGVSEEATPGGFACWATFFLGATQPCRAEPLVFLNYTPELGLDNKARAGRSGEIEVTAYHHEPGGPKIGGLKLWISTNDGATWQPAKVKSRGNGVYEGDVKYPRLSQTNGFVSLKAEAWDVAGNRVEQTVTRAFGLREGGGDDDDDDDDDDD